MRIENEDPGASRAQQSPCLFLRLVYDRRNSIRNSSGRRSLAVEVYVVVNKVMSGREAMEAFSTLVKAQKFMDRWASKTGYVCQIEKSFVRGYYEPPHRVFAAHTYDRHEDVHVLEGIYAALSQAQMVAGQGGEIIEFSIDSPEDNQVFMNV
jgi:hypothetical protein